MIIRAIHPAEIPAFVEAATRAEDAEAIQTYLDRLLTGGYTQAAWCFVAEEAGQFVGRVAYWTLPCKGQPTDIVLLDLPWEHDYRTSGTRLLAESAAIMRRHGATDLEYVLDLPALAPQWQHFPEQRQHLLAQAGFVQIRETLRFSLDHPPAIAPGPARLTFHTLAEAGEVAFLDAIARVSAGSLDQRDRDDRAEQGATGAARTLFRIVQSLDHDPGWWQLAYAASGELVGLVMPAGTPSWSTIGYIGVVPEQRGRGYINDLLAQGTALLAASGTTRIETDTDVANTPMAAAFRRAGYTRFATRREYRRRQAG
ncbi:MAG TPA: GNAT family N-acetyltransferase [Chloroflexia bacterium]|nr:GNAT family N-acetyltransferase [Chloroflexia bacterium]